MKQIKLAAACLNQTPLDWEGNLARILSAISQAREAGVGVLCLPELAVTGYGCDDAFLSPAVQKSALEALGDIARETGGMVVAVGLPLTFQNALYDVVAVLADGNLVGFVPKQHLAGDGIHYEPRWFHAWPSGVVEEIWIEDAWVPVGDLLFGFDGVRVGFEICEDAWVANRPGASLARRGADIILNPSASHFSFHKQETRQRIVSEGSRSFRVAYVYANLLGNEAGRAIYDGGAMIATGGDMVARGARLSFEEVLVTCATVDLDRNRCSQNWAASYHPAFGPEGGGVVEVEFSIRQSCEPSTPQLAEDGVGTWDADWVGKEDEFTRAVALGLFDYARKSRSRGFVLSLSGGADSASCAALVWAMVHLAKAELGEKAAADRLGLKSLAMPEMLTCVYQATRNSSTVTREAAKAVAEGVGATFYEFDVDGIVENYRATVENSIGRKLSWEMDDLALQNIQARVRSPGVWMLANLQGALLLATSNRSEASVGYATMDGDTSGGLSPLVAIDKAFIREWLVWMEKTGPTGITALPTLAAVNAQEPTAELRPSEEGQTDEEDLMPYTLLERIEQLAIHDRYAPVEVYRALVAEEAPWSANQLKLWIRRFFELWSRNQWKRERYAPSFHLDDRNLDPRTWCRFPILNGGFRKELKELDQE